MQLKKHNVELRDRSTAARHYDLDLTDIMDLSSETGSYWFGFFLSDGYMPKTTHRIRINLAYKDIGHLYKLSRSLKSTIQPKKGQVRCAGKTFDRAYISINNKELYEFYQQAGWPEYKQGIIKLEKLNLNMKHFLRGLWDGDGTVTHNKNRYLRLGFCSRHYPIIEWVQTQIIKLVLTQYQETIKINKISKQLIYNTWWCGHDALLIGRALYTNCTLYLDRKAQRVMSFVNRPSH
jgi:hypothetical protein